MSRNIFSNIFSLKSLKLFLMVIIFVFFGLNSLTTEKAGARILIYKGCQSSGIFTDCSKDLDKSITDNVDILYDSVATTPDKLSIVINKTETEHGDLLLSSASATLIKTYLDLIKKKRVDEMGVLKTVFSDTYSNRPDLVIFKYKMDQNNLPEQLDGTIKLDGNSIKQTSKYDNTVQGAATATKIQAIINSTSSKEFILVLNFANGIYTKMYDKFFNGAAALKNSQFKFNDDFQNDAASPLQWILINKYFKDLRNHLVDKTDAESTIVKQRIEEMISLSDLRLTLGGSKSVSLDANGVNWPWKIGDNDTGAQDFDAAKILPSIPWADFENGTIDADTITNNATNQVTAEPVKPSCTAEGLWSVMKSNNCSVTAYLINGLLQGINSLATIITGWFGALFNWIFDISVMNFKDWVDNSNAVGIYKTIILAFIASILLPLVFYLIIMMLINNDSADIEKLLPKILITALFIYFSFGIAGWLVDQSNTVTIYIYRAIHGGDTSQNFGDAMTGTLKLKSGHTVAQSTTAEMAQWDTVPYSLGNIIINLVAMYVIFQAMILMFARAIVLLLCLIFSPLMVLPDGLPGSIGKFITNWRGKVITYFTNNLLLAPIFMFLMMIAIQIGGLSGSLIKTNEALDGATGPGGSGFLTGIISTILVVVVMQLAISVAKNLSGEVGASISAKISSFAGGVAGGALGAFNKIRSSRTSTNSNKIAPGEWTGQTQGGKKGIPLQNVQSKVITPSSGPAPDTKTRSFAGYQAISAQRNKMNTNRNSTEQKATQNNRSVGVQSQVNQDRIQRKLAENKAKVEQSNSVTVKPLQNNPRPASPNKPVSEVRQKMGELDKQGIGISKDFKNTSFTNRRAGVELVRGEINKVSSDNKLRTALKSSRSGGNKNNNLIRNLKERGRGRGNSGAQELSNSTVSANPPRLTLDRGSGNKQEIPLPAKKENNLSQKNDRSQIDLTRKILDNKTASGSALPSLAKFNDQGTTALREKLRANNGELAKKFINMSQKDQEALKLSTTIQAAAKRIREMKKNGAK